MPWQTVRDKGRGRDASSALRGWVMTISAWRGLRGMCIADHFVVRGERKAGTLLGRLQLAPARHAQSFS